MTRALRIPFLSLAAMAALAWNAAPSFAKPGVSEDFRWEGRIAAGRTVEVHGVNGEIVVEPSSGDRIEVRAVKSARRSDPSEVRIQVTEDSQGVLICAVYPGAGNACERGNHSSHTHNNDVTVNFQLSVPAGVRLDANTVNGGIDVRGLSGPVRARTVNGNCSIATRGSGDAATVNGSVQADIGRLGGDDELEFGTVNGSITLRLPSRPDARFEGSTVNGSISTDFPLTVKGRWGPRNLSGTLGTGAGRVKVTTVNGSIRLSKSGERSL